MNQYGGGSQWGYSNKDNARQTQIQNFLRTFPSGKCIGNDPETYEMPIKVGNSKLFLKIFLDKTFPLQPPLIQVMALVAHPMVDHNMYIHHRDCDNWTTQSALVNVLMDVVKQFQANPPKPRPRKSTGPGNVQATNAARNFQARVSDAGIVQSGGGGASMNVDPSVNVRSNSDARRPSQKDDSLKAPVQFQELFQLDPVQLENLANKSDELDDYAREHVMVRSLIDRHDELLRENTLIATETITGKEELEELSLKYKSAVESFEKVKTESEELSQSQQMIIQRFSRANVLQHLEDKIKDIQDRSRASEKEAISNAVDSEEFLESLLEQRKVYHIMMAKKIRYSLNEN